ncbi:MAG: alpha/beta hydrolase [Agarilytica sp.]
MKLYIFSFLLILTGCSSSFPYVPEKQPLDSSSLPAPDLTLSIPSLSVCTDSDDKSIVIDSQSPLTVLVHGCNGSAGRFRSLAQLYAFHGQQAVCYSYDDRDSLIQSADKLAVAVGELASNTTNQNITIIGHSMGGLIARKAVEKSNDYAKTLSDIDLELITISAPLSGIDAANHCGLKPLHWFSAGIIPGICWLITGDNWYEITSSSSFIRNPEPLIPSVEKYLKIVTNEKNTCRRKAKDGSCIESDYVFDLSEQYHTRIDNYQNVTGVQVDAGHVEIVGDKRIVPRKLLSILQEYDMLSDTPPNRKEALEQLFADLY